MLNSKKILQGGTFLLLFASLIAFSAFRIFHPGASVNMERKIAILLEDFRNFNEAVPLRAIIKVISGHRIRNWKGEEKAALIKASRDALAGINREGIVAQRANEAGNRVEVFVRKALIENGFKAEIPLTPSGRRKTAGYPDLAVERDGETFYIEVKTYHPKNADTTQRSFYLSPSDDFKVTHDAFHLLIAFALEPDAEGKYRARSVKWLDLFDLKGRLKIEFNAANRDLYADRAGLLFFEN